MEFPNISPSEISTQPLSTNEGFYTFCPTQVPPSNENVTHLFTPHPIPQCESLFEVNPSCFLQDVRGYSFDPLEPSPLIPPQLVNHCAAPVNYCVNPHHVVDNAVLDHQKKNSIFSTHSPELPRKISSDATEEELQDIDPSFGLFGRAYVENERNRLLELCAIGQSPPDATERTEFYEKYLRLLDLYDQDIEDCMKNARRVCLENALSTHIPFIDDKAVVCVDGETEEESIGKVTVRRRFVLAVDRFQKQSQEVKQRGNLPKEATNLLKKWFQKNLDHPCKLKRLELRFQFACNLGLT